jgi:RimJ/RimL family protein N-acetyltransferase
MKNSITFRQIKISDAKILLRWRKKKRISKFQFTDIQNSLINQKKWIKNSYNKNNYYHWIVLFKKKPIGFFNINHIDIIKKKASWAWYIGSEKYISLGGFIPPYFYNWVFNSLNIKKLDIYVFANNTNVIKIHKIHGYIAYKKKYFILKNKKKISYIKMYLLKKNWKFDTHKKYDINFPINLWKTNLITTKNEKKNN